MLRYSMSLISTSSWFNTWTNFSPEPTIGVGRNRLDISANKSCLFNPQAFTMLTERFAFHCKLSGCCYLEWTICSHYVSIHVQKERRQTGVRMQWLNLSTHEAVHLRRPGGINRRRWVWRLVVLLICNGCLLHSTYLCLHLFSPLSLNFIIN